MYKALITDLDGTAVTISSNGDEIDQATKQSVHRAVKAGRKISCATGRHWEIAKPVVKALGLKTPCIIEGGTRIIDPLRETTLWEKPLDSSTAAAVFALFKAQGKQGYVMIPEITDQLPLKGLATIPQHPRFLYLLAIPESTAITIANTINLMDSAAAHYTPSWSGQGLVDLHITHREATKQHAIKIWQKLEGIKKSETIGLGDSGNDIPIFEAVGFKIAVGNATPNLKTFADYIAPTLEEHALQYVIDTFLL